MNPSPTSALMSLEEARQVPMIFERYNKRTMGSLLDSGELAMKDLQYVAQKGIPERARIAAQIILNDIQNQLKETNILPPLNVVTSKYRSYAERKQMELTLYYGLMTGLVIGALITGAIVYTLARTPSETTVDSSILLTPVGIFALLLLLLIFLLGFGIFMWIMNWLTDRFTEEVQRHRKGQKAEERVLNSMYYALDANWWLFRNLELPNRKADLDFVLLGQKGIWVFEVKFYEGEFRNREKNWEAHIGSKWKPAFKNPTVQALGNATKLSQFLKTQNLAHWVNPVVVWANPESVLQLENPHIPVWTLDNLTSELAKLNSPKTLDAAKMQEIIELLKKLIEDNDK